MDIKYEKEYIQNYLNGKFYMRDEFYRQYTAKMIEMCDVPGMLNRLKSCGFAPNFKSQLN